MRYFSDSDVAPSSSRAFRHATLESSTWTSVGAMASCYASPLENVYEMKDIDSAATMRGLPPCCPLTILVAQELHHGLLAHLHHRGDSG